jgi:phage major head subunit gpT-like protein
MFINQPNLDALFIAFNENFKDAYMGEPQPLLEAIGSRIPSSTRDQRYPFIQALSGAMRKWQGERQVQNVVAQGFVVTNAKWENTLSIAREDIEDDQYQVYSQMLIPNLARHAKLLPDQQIAAAITGNAVGFDGLSFFNTAHPTDPSGLTAGTQSNALVLAGGLNQVNLAKAQAAMMNFLGPDGLPIGCYGDTILCPPSLKFVADTLANATFYPTAQNGQTSVFGSQQNVWQSQFKVVATPWLPDTGDATTAVWYLLDCRAANLRPFFWQEREAAQLVQLVDPSNPAVFFQDNFYMGARARGAAAAALWFKAIRATIS